MKLNLFRNLAPAAMALGLAGGGLLLASTPAFAAGHSHVAAHSAATVAKAHKPVAKTDKPVVKAGSACTKAELGKKALAGKSTLVCEKVGKVFRWEVKAAAKPVAKKAVKPVAKKAAKK